MLPETPPCVSTFSGFPKYFIPAPLLALAISSFDVLTVIPEPLLAFTWLDSANKSTALMLLPLDALAKSFIVSPDSLILLPLEALHSKTFVLAFKVIPLPLDDSHFSLEVLTFTTMLLPLLLVSSRFSAVIVALECTLLPLPADILETFLKLTCTFFAEAQPMFFLVCIFRVPSINSATIRSCRFSSASTMTPSLLLCVKYTSRPSMALMASKEPFKGLVSSTTLPLPFMPGFRLMSKLHENSVRLNSAATINFVSVATMIFDRVVITVYFLIVFVLVFKYYLIN